MHHQNSQVPLSYKGSETSPMGYQWGSAQMHSIRTFAQITLATMRCSVRF